jgi:gliding motility-associated-like protein
MKLFRFFPLLLLMMAGLAACDKRDESRTAHCNCSGSYYRFSANGSNVSFPSAFTPNGDGRNDVFRAIASNIEDGSFQLTIFDETGKQVFATGDRHLGWDGNLGNGSYASGRYEAQFSFRTSSGTSISSCTCFYALSYEQPAGCLRASPGSYAFEDQFESFGGQPVYATSEYLCP